MTLILKKFEDGESKKKVKESSTLGRLKAAAFFVCVLLSISRLPLGIKSGTLLRAILTTKTRQVNRYLNFVLQQILLKKQCCLFITFLIFNTN